MSSNPNELFERVLADLQFNAAEGKAFIKILETMNKIEINSALDPSREIEKIIDGLED